MKVLITGGSGFVGSRLSNHFIEKEHEVTVVDLPPRPKPGTPAAVRYLSADTTRPGPWQEEAARQDLIVNLAGSSIFGRWSRASKALLHDSRILTTRQVVSAMSPGGAGSLISASAVGYYGFRGDEILTEESGPGNDFLAKLCEDWEREAGAAEEKGVRVVIARFGIVFGRNGGALQEMLSAFEKHRGGPLGTGKQWFSWIHMADLSSALLFLAGRSDISGPVNCCAPNPVRNKDLARELGTILQRPSSIPTPAFLVRMALGESASILLEGQRVLPKVLQQKGFQFRFPELPEALADLLSKR